MVQVYWWDIVVTLASEIIYVVVFSGAALAAFAGLVRARKVEHAGTRYGLLGLFAGSGGWAGAHAGLFLAPTPALKTISYTAGLILGFSTVFSWLYFASAYTGRSYHLDRRLRIAGLGLYLGVVVVKLTNPLHHLYYTAEVVREPFLRVAISQQVFHWVVTGLSYALAAVGLFMLFEQFREAGYDTRGLVALTGVTALPVVFDIVGFASDLFLNVIYAPLGVAAFAIGVLYVYEDRFLAVQLTGDVDDAFVFLDEDGEIRDFNDAALALFPSLSGMRGRSVDAIEPIAQALDSDSEVTGLTVDGDRRYFLLNTTSFTLGQSDIGRVLVFSDVTAIERQRRELERHNSQLEEFAEGIRHELRNSLQVISARVNAAGSALDTGDVDRARDSLEVASGRTGRMSRTVADLATLAQHGRTVGGLEEVDLRRIAEESWEKTDVADVDLTIQHDGTIRADRSRLSALFESVFEFAHHNDASTVTVSLDDDCVSITDDGMRPPDDKLDQLFDYGHAVPTAEAGMALPNVETLAEVHGWSVSVDESYDDGIRLRVTDVIVEQREATTP